MRGGPAGWSPYTLGREAENCLNDARSVVRPAAFGTGTACSLAKQTLLGACRPGLSLSLTRGKLGTTGLGFKRASLLTKAAVSRPQSRAP